jgi:hypothetical protein
MPEILLKKNWNQKYYFLFFSKEESTGAHVHQIFTRSYFLCIPKKKANSFVHFHKTFWQAQLACKNVL